LADVRAECTCAHAEEEGGAKAVQAQLKMCYKKDDTYCGSFISGVVGIVSWVRALFVSHSPS
jgi:hypothetical protein